MHTHITHWQVPCTSTCTRTHYTLTSTLYEYMHTHTLHTDKYPVRVHAHPHITHWQVPCTSACTHTHYTLTSTLYEYMHTHTLHTDKYPVQVPDHQASVPWYAICTQLSLTPTCNTIILMNTLTEPSSGRSLGRSSFSGEPWTLLWTQWMVGTSHCSY